MQRAAGEGETVDATDTVIDEQRSQSEKGDKTTLTEAEVVNLEGTLRRDSDGSFSAEGLRISRQTRSPGRVTRWNAGLLSGIALITGAAGAWTAVAKITNAVGEQATALKNIGLAVQVNGYVQILLNPSAGPDAQEAALRSITTLNPTLDVPMVAPPASGKPFAPIVPSTPPPGSAWSSSPNTQGSATVPRHSPATPISTSSAQRVQESPPQPQCARSPEPTNMTLQISKSDESKLVRSICEKADPPPEVRNDSGTGVRWYQGPFPKTGGADFDSRQVWCRCLLK